MKKFFLSMSAMVLSFFVLFGCSNDVDNSSLILAQLIKGNTYSGPVANLSVSAEVLDSASRAIYVSDIQSAKAIVEGFDYTGKAFSKESPLVSVSSGKGSGITVSSIPVCKNAVVTVKAYADAKGIVNLDGIVITQRVDINQGENNSATVSWNTSKEGNVYAALIKAGVNTNTLTDTQKSSIAGAIPTDIHAALIDAGSIASDYKSNSLKSSSYKLTAGTVKVTCNDYDGCTLQVNDPVSSNGTAVKGSVVTISNVAPGTWTLYVLDGTTVKTSKSVVVTGGNEASVTLGSSSFDGIQIQVAKSLGYSLIHYWSCSDKTKYPNTSWPGTAMLTDWCDDDYIYNFEGCSSVKLLITDSAENKLCSSDIEITAKGAYRITSSGASASTYISDVPPEPVAPTVTISPVDGSQIAVNGSISVQFTNGNDTITSAKVTVNGTEYNMGTTAGTWSKSLSELGITSEGVTVTVSASVTNSVGTGTASASLTTKAASKLVTNPNELRIYQVMVASFQDGDSSIGYTDMWGPSGALKGGDLQGIINAIPYIKGLGCNALWMTPIFTSNGTADYKLNATGYFAGNYFEIDPNFGTIDTFKELVKQCHENGIAVILDGVFGHTSAAKGGYVVSSPNGKTPTGADPVNYTDTNTQAFFKEVAEYWIKNYKIDGWRLDQCYQVSLGENATGSDKCNTGGHNYWYDIRKVVEQAAASNGTKGTDWGTLGYMVGEHWRGDATLIQNGSVVSGTAAGYGLNSCFDFPAYYQLVQGFACEYGQSSKTTDNITTGLSYLYKTYTEKGYSCKEDDGTYETYYPNCMLTNHDLYRIGDVIKGKWGCGYDSDEYIGRNKVILAAQCAYSGPITIYYGDEIGDHSVDLSGWGSDNVARSSGKITGFNSREQAIHDWTQKCLAARADHEALWNGTNTQITGQSDFYVAKKQGGGETIYIAFNYNKSSSKSFSLSGTGTDLISGETFTGTVTVPALSARYILVK